MNETSWNWNKLKTYYEIKNKSIRTIEKYEEYFYLIPKHLELDPLKINEWLMTNKYSISTKHTLSSIIKSYFKAIGRKKEIKDIESIYYKSKEIDLYLIEDECKLMIDTAKTKYFKLAIKTIFYTGMRRGILLNITPEMMDDEITGFNIPHDLKGNKKRKKFFIPLPRSLFIEIMKYIYENKIEIDERIFKYTKKDGSIFKNEDISFTMAIKQIAKKSGLSGNISPHNLRHSYATNYVKCGGREEMLNENLGSNIAKRYVHTKADTQQKETDKLFN